MPLATPPPSSDPRRWRWSEPQVDVTQAVETIAEMAGDSRLGPWVYGRLHHIAFQRGPAPVDSPGPDPMPVGAPAELALRIVEVWIRSGCTLAVARDRALRLVHLAAFDALHRNVMSYTTVARLLKPDDVRRAQAGSTPVHDVFALALRLEKVTLE